MMQQETEEEMRDLAREEAALLGWENERLESLLKGKLLSKDEQQVKNTLPGDTGRHRRRRGGALCPRPFHHVHEVCREDALEDGAPQYEHVRPGRLQGGHRGRGGARCLSEAEVRKRRAPGTEGTGDGVSRDGYTPRPSPSPSCPSRRSWS